MKKLKSILGLKFIRNIPKENKIAYLISVGIGVGASVLIVIIPNFFSHGTGFENNIFALSIFTPIPILSIILLLILSNKFPVVWKNIRTRIICILFLLFAYIIGFYLPMCLFPLDNFSCFLLSFLAPFIVFPFNIILLLVNPTQSPLLTTFLYSNIFIIIVAYLATKEIVNLPKRIILFLIIAFLICATAATPLFVKFLST